MNLRSRKPKTTESDGILTKSLTHSDGPNQIGNQINQGSKNNNNTKSLIGVSLLGPQTDKKEEKPDNSKQQSFGTANGNSFQWWY